MNYLKHYCLLMRKAEERTGVTGYTERHHIFPRSIYGPNTRIVVLTAREHFVAHKLLYKGCMKRYGIRHIRTQKMLHAFRCMCTFKLTGREIECRITSHDWAVIRKHNSTRIKGDNNHAKRPEVREVISQAKKDKPRPDLRGKSYFGTSKDPEDIISRGVQTRKKNFIERKKRIGKKTNYPSNRQSPPCSEEKKLKIAESRRKTNEKYRKMSKSTFRQWLLDLKQHDKLINKRGYRNANITRALTAREENEDDYLDIFGE